MYLVEKIFFEFYFIQQMKDLIKIMLFLKSNMSEMRPLIFVALITAARDVLKKGVS